MTMIDLSGMAIVPSDQVVDGMPFGPIAHRGACSLAPENSLEAFDMALELGARWIEFDVHRAGSRLYISHDPLPAAAAAAAPALEEVLDLVGDRCGCNIELKGRGTGAPVAALLAERRSDPQRLLVSSFRPRELRRFRALSAEAPLAPLAWRYRPGLLALADELAARSINLAWTFLKRHIVDEIHAAGRQVLVFTVDDPAVIAELRAWGVDGFFTDRIQDHCRPSDSRAPCET